MLFKTSEIVTELFSSDLINIKQFRKNTFVQYNFAKKHFNSISSAFRNCKK